MEPPETRLLHARHVQPLLQLLPQWVLDVILFTRSAFVDTLVLRTVPHMAPSLAVHSSKIRCYLSKFAILSACSLTVTRLQVGPCSSKGACLWVLFPGTTRHFIQCYETHLLFYPVFSVSSSAGAGCYSIRPHWSWRHSDSRPVPGPHEKPGRDYGPLGPLSTATSGTTWRRQYSEESCTHALEPWV